MRGKKYQALIVVILLLTALPYSPFLSRASSIEKDPLAEKDTDGDGIKSNELGEDGHTQSANIKNQLNHIKRNTEQLMSIMQPDSEYPATQ